MDLLLKILEKSITNIEVIMISAVLLSLSWYLLLEKRKRAAGALFFLGGVITLGFLTGVLEWISGLGGDSFLEVNDFNLKEAFFWGQTFLTSLMQMLMPLNKNTILVVLETLVLSIILFLAIRRWNFLSSILKVFLVVLVGYSIYSGYVAFKSGRESLRELQKQFNNNPVGFSAKEDIDLFVYIGESTSSLNMSLYGYPRETTPLLDSLYRTDVGFLRFDKVRSTHTHTSSSLLRALAIAKFQQNELPVLSGIGSVLKNAGLLPKLYSVQPLNGSFAAFSHFVFDGFHVDLSKDDRYKGNLAKPKFKDHELLESAITQSGVVFFHSYAGHGAYLDHIDVSKSNNFPKLPIKYEGVFGSAFSGMAEADLSKNVIEYDQALTYVDRNVSHAIELIKSRSKPAVLIYFSDHGEAVYAGRGHDSSKYIDEMTTVPMVIYFNKAYREKYKKIFDRYKVASQAVKTKFLDQISSTILDVMQVSSTYPLDVPTLASEYKHPHPDIVERQTISGYSKINFDYDVKLGFSNAKFYGGTVEPTYVSMINEKLGGENTICYHRSNSFAKALRGASVANCLEFDLVVDGSELNVYHPPTNSTGFRIEHIFSIAQARKNSLWIDAKNINDSVACDKLATFLEGNYSRVGKIFVEFPWQSGDNLADLKSCGKRLNSIGVRTSYYVPTHFLIPCAEDPIKNTLACERLGFTVKKSIASGVFSDLSFDYLGLPAMKQIKDAENLKWNTWAIKPKDFDHFPRHNFDFVIMDSSFDPNGY